MTQMDTGQNALDAIDPARGPTLVLVESADGSVGDLVDHLPSGVRLVKRALAAEASRAVTGAIAEQLGLADPTPGAYVVEEAQWADASSLGRLQRLLTRQIPGLIVVLAYRLGEHWGIEKVAESARRHGTIHEIARSEERRVGKACRTRGVLEQCTREEHGDRHLCS